MELVRRWLEILGAPELAADLAALPGRDPYASGPGSPRGIQSAEWSLREGSAGVRFAWNVDRDHVSTAEVFAVLARWTPLSPEVRSLLRLLQGVHLQVGRDGPRSKLYIYARGAPPVTLQRVGEVLGVHVPPEAAFAAIDLVSDLALKHYVEGPRGELGAWLREHGAASLADWSDSLPADLGTPRSAFVASVRRTTSGHYDVTIHVNIREAPERLAQLAGADLGARAASAFRDAARLGLRLCPTHVSRLLPPSGVPIRTVYYRLEPLR